MIVNNITINGNQVNFKYGLTITDILNQDLNTGLLIIPQTNNIQIEPFDQVVITYETTKQLNMIVGNYVKKISKFSGTKLYDYEITLVSPTIKLQRIVLPNRSITRKISVDSSLSIYEVMFRYLLMYAPDISMNSSLVNLTSSVQCPEMSWNRPTLFEVFNDLLITVGCVITMPSFNTLGYLDLSLEGNQIDEQYINNYEYSMDITEYASAVEVEAQNVYSKDSITKTPNPINIRTTESVRITTENQEILLQKPIFTIEKVYALTRTTMGTDNIYKFDITDRVVPQSVYDLLQSSNSTGYVQDTPTVKYRRNHLYFNQGSNVISGLAYREDAWLSFVDTKAAIVHVMRWAYEDYFGTSVPDSTKETEAEEFNSILWDELSFLVEYTTTDNVLFRSRKEIPTKHESILINNQTNSFVYSDLLGKQQQEFINRIGNEELVITGRYNAYNDIPALNDYIDEYKLIQREIQFQGTYYLLKGTLSKNYSKENMFAGINTQKRYTELAQESDSFISNHISEFFYRFGFENTIGDDESFSSYVINNYGESGNNIDGAIVNTQFSDNSISENFLLEGTPYNFGNSFVYTIRMSDNINVAYSLADEALLFGGQTLKLVPYTDDFGNFKKINIRLYSQGGILEEAINPNYVNNFSASRNFLEVNKNSSKLPIIENTRIYWTDETTSVEYNPLVSSKKILETDYINRYKDNREITNESLQFHIFPNDDIIITNKFFKYLPPLYHIDTNEQFKVAYSTTEVYQKGNLNYKGDIIPTSEVNIIKVGNRLSIQKASGTLDFNSFTSWAILNSDFELLIGVNANGNQSIWLNKE